MADGNITRFKEVLDQIGICGQEKEYLAQKFAAALGETPVEELFEPCGSGSYKSVYFLDDEKKWVMKFVDHDNPTGMEMEVYEAAEEEGLQQYFAPTFWFWLNTNDVEYSMFAYDYVVIQQTCVLRDQETWDIEEADDHLFEDKQWVDDFVEAYGVKAIVALKAFADEWGLCDIHAANTAYLEDKWPVIIDWMSGDNDTDRKDI